MLLPDSTDQPISLTRWYAAQTARCANAAQLAELLRDSRQRTLALADAYVTALGSTLPVPYAPTLNPPLWELGHVAWFQEFWNIRNTERHLGIAANPLGQRLPSLLPQADALYNSSLVSHISRWHLPLPDLSATQRYLADSLDTTLALLNSRDGIGDAGTLYFARLALFHEDMHTEAAVYMAQTLGIHLPPELTQTRQSRQAHPDTLQALPLQACDWSLGYGGQPGETGFAFDNELHAHAVSVPAFEIDASPVTWRRYLPFVEAGGSTLPRYVRQTKTINGQLIWEHCHYGHWQPLDMDSPACHLTYFEAQAWCHWAGRQLPTEAQWEYAAMTDPNFQWGEVWEWTSSAFNPYPGFTPHPYQDYSQPWFDSRMVLRGASTATSERMAHPRYRNYFTPERNDIHAGFRTCVMHAPT